MSLGWAQNCGLVLVLLLLVGGGWMAGVSVLCARRPGLLRRRRLDSEEQMEILTIVDYWQALPPSEQGMALHRFLEDRSRAGMAYGNEIRVFFELAAHHVGNRP